MFDFLLINSSKLITFSSVRAVFGRPLPSFCSVAEPAHQSSLQIAFTEQSFQPFFGNFATFVQYPKPSFHNVSIRALSSYDILPITEVIGLTAITTWNIEELRAYYNAIIIIIIIIKYICKALDRSATKALNVARKHKKIMTSQQRWYLLLNYFNNEINFLFSCKIRSWILRFSQFDVRQVNTEQSNALVHSIVPEKWAKFGAKIFRHFWDSSFCVGIFYFASPCRFAVIGSMSVNGNNLKTSYSTQLKYAT